ncbi:MAG: ABC transporter permease [Methanomicrobiales archaeon]|nr:ABC transporter permease [Methanomicrobiales archaeon]MDI6876622.1 ABC transporter permease [Methanomicrobiales archaeon]
MIFFEFARRNIRLHWFRSLLAVIGIVIGVLAISSLGILGNSLVLSVSESLTDVGDTLVITPGAGGFGMGGGQTAQKISPRDVEEIQRIAAPNAVIPLHVGGDRIALGSEIGAATIYGMREDDIPLLLEIDRGIYPRGASGAMVGSQLAERFNIAPGSRISIGSDGESVRVVGILKSRGAGFDINPDYAVIVSDRIFSTLYGEADWDQVIVKVRNLDDITPVKERIEAKFNRREPVLNVLETRVILEAIFDVFGQITTFTLAIGGISLVVAGVSILNVMMMSVSERTREIGVLRSIGTRRTEVLRMFVYESLLLGLIGSLIGGVLSLGGGYVLLFLMVQNTSYLFVPSTLVYIPFGMAVGIATSVLSGFYPAYKASNLNPVEALRHE